MNNLACSAEVLATENLGSLPEVGNAITFSIKKNLFFNRFGTIFRK